MIGGVDLLEAVATPSVGQRRGRGRARATSADEQKHDS